MIKTLVDFFLLISTDKKTITFPNLSTFYNFITKKLPEIESHRPALITSSLNQQNKQKNNEDKTIKSFIYQNEDNINNINKKNKNIELKGFQNELLSLFNDMIDYLYEEKIIILSEDRENTIKRRVEQKLKEKKIINKKINNEFNNILIKNIQKTQIRKYLIELIISNNNNNNVIMPINFTIKDYINFFNNKNRDKNRYIIDRFINVIIPVIKTYKTDTKNNAKKFNKIKTKSLSKLQEINIDCPNDNNKSRSNNNILTGYKEGCNAKDKNSKNISSYFYQINKSFNNKKKENFSLNDIIIKSNKNKNNKKKVNNKNELISKENDMNDKNNMTKDTIPGQTLKNYYSFYKIPENILNVNYLRNNINKKKIGNNINKNNTNTNRIKCKIIFYYPKSHIDNINIDQSFYSKNKSILYRLKKKVNGNGNAINESEIYSNNTNENKNKNRSSYMELFNKKYLNALNESNSGCFIH